MASVAVLAAKQTLAPFRLRRHADYQHVYQASRKHFSASMAYFFCLRAGEAGPRVGLTVGRVMGKAVTRNRIKRRMREAVRLHLGALQGAPAVDLVLHPRKAVAEMEFAALEQEVARVLRQVAGMAAAPGTHGAGRPGERRAARAKNKPDKQNKPAVAGKRP
ncbi:MAG TPA: ribonuclease P protein component [Acidobacteriaceae bacterium]